MVIYEIDNGSAEIRAALTEKRNRRFELTRPFPIMRGHPGRRSILFDVSRVPEAEPARGTWFLGKGSVIWLASQGRIDALLRYH